MFQQRTLSFEMLILFWIYLNLWSAWHRQTDFWHLIKSFCALAWTKSLLGKRKKSLNFHLKTFWIKMKRFLIFRLLLESSWNVNQSFLMLEPIYYSTFLYFKIIVLYLKKVDCFWLKHDHFLDIMNVWSLIVLWGSFMQMKRRCYLTN